MFKRENRLVKTVSFKNSYSYSFPQFVLKKQKNNLSLNRFSIVVSKKVDKKAVVRNKVKRLFREILGELNKKMSVGNDILFIAKTEIVKKTKEENIMEIKKAVEKAGLI